jgi:tRNA nucleotidyltransferase (CCA-adding enzyme)
MRPGKVMSLLEDLDAVRSRDISAFVQACEADFRGRKGRQDADYPQGRYLSAALEAALSVRTESLDLDSQTPGPEIGQRLRAARIAAIAECVVDLGQ